MIKNLSNFSTYSTNLSTALQDVIARDGQISNQWQSRTQQTNNELANALAEKHWLELNVYKSLKIINK